MLFFGKSSDFNFNIILILQQFKASLELQHFTFKTMALCHKYGHFTSKGADRVHCFCLLWIRQEIAYNESALKSSSYII